MGFERYLEEKSKSEWSLYYINYKYLKNMIMEMSQRFKRGTWTKKDAEHKFTTAIELEIVKVNDFFLLVQKEMEAKLAALKLYLNKNKSINNAVTEESLIQHMDKLAEKLTDLHEFTHVNFTGFKKIIKKHDRYTDMVASPWFLERCKEQTFYCSSNELGNMLVKLSACYTQARQLMGKAEEAKEVIEGGRQNFQRTTTKYWVKQEDIMRVKTLIAKHLPVNIFTSKSARFRTEQTDSAYISSCYYDNPDTMELYEGRLRKTQGAIALRFREYAGGKEIFVERKTHIESWVTGAASIKERFDLDPSDVFDFIRGTYKTEDFIKRLKERKKSEEDIKDAVKLFEEAQYVILQHNLLPTMTTAYYRTAFQIPGNANVRISIDTNLQMIKENMRLYNDGKWRKDAFQISEEDVHDFPYAVLEVKLETHEGVEPPEWVRNLVASPLVREAHKFSKFIHGCAMLVPNRVPNWPVWIREFTEGEDKTIGDSFAAQGAVRDSYGMLIEMKDLSGDSEPLYPYEQPRETVFTKIKHFFDMDRRFPRLKEAKMNRVKLEPKTYFANERTFLKWVSFGLIIQGVGLSMFSSSDSWYMYTLGFFMILVSLCCMGYSLYNFRWRAAHIRNQAEGRYDDIYGPVALFGLMTTAVIISAVFQVTRRIEAIQAFQLQNDYSIYY